MNIMHNYSNTLKYLYLFCLFIFFIASNNHVSWYFCECALKTDMEEKKLLNEVFILFSLLNKITVEPLMSHGLF